MIELNTEILIYKIIYSSSYYLLDISYHYFESIFSGFFSETMLVLFLISS